MKSHKHGDSLSQQITLHKWNIKI